MVKLMNINENDGDFTFIVRKVFLATPDLVSDQAGYEDVQDLLELLKVSNLFVSTYERCLLFKLLHVDIDTPDYSYEDPKDCSVGVIEVT